MVAQSDLGQVKALSDERIQISNAIYAVDAGGQIVSVAVGLPPNIPPQVVGYISYPPSVLAEISNAWNLRLQEIIRELADLGVTDLEPLPPPPWTEPMPEPPPFVIPAGPTPPQQVQPQMPPPPSSRPAPPKPQPKPAARKRK